MGRITETVKILIIINVIVYAGSMLLGDTAYRLLSLYYFENPNFQYWQPVTHMFMHDQHSFMHILFNMLGLYFFGPPLEARWGQKKFLFFYFSAGIGAALIHSLVTYFQVSQGLDLLAGAGMTPVEITEMLQTGQYRSSILQSIPIETIESVYREYNTPAVGASGAIYGLLVGFALLYPNVELMMMFIPIPIKAKYFVPGLILLDLFSGLTGFSVFGQNIANWAHIGGAAFGFIMAYYWKKNDLNNTRWD
ncbi:rhomboid family intramembrane serine protease [Patiriisocius marinus]|uniref:Rhomboid family intramembrane serine protease n=1 Tax=Patiriisocius marinus TaxID=1397112 RepID=A0A5J4IZS8_9FLAO|nr:rhomboid family intramembrane serine protease [Patiriisocius marinus]GER59003.1 rhomboid family intramembrane serine protease [Patiriisocius marinus]